MIRWCPWAPFGLTSKAVVYYDVIKYGGGNMSDTSEFLKLWGECLANKNSAGIEKFLSEDFENISRSGTLNKQQTLDWTASGGPSPKLENIKTLYENDEVGVITCNTDSDNGKSLQMIFARKLGSQFCHWERVRQPM